MAAKRSSPTAKYLARAKAFAEAVEIGIAVYEAHPPPDEDGLPHAPADAYAQDSNGLAEQALAPAPPFANLKSLAYLEDAFFTFWNESRGPHVAPFWRAVAERELPFARRDVIGELLKRGKIRDDIEHEHVTDAMGMLRDWGQVSAEDEARLSAMLGAYEARARR